MENFHGDVQQFLNCSPSRGLDFHDNNLQFMTKKGAINNLELLQNARQVNITEITARFIFTERHLTLLPNAFFFFKTRRGFDACIYVTVQITSADFFRVS